MGKTTGRLLLGGVLLAGVALRWWGSLSDLPYVFNADEALNIGIVQHIVKTGDLNPHAFNYPSLFFYVQALAYLPYFLGGYVLGVFHHMADIGAPVSLVMGTTFAPTPGAVVLGRVITMAFGAATVGLVYAIGARFGRSRWPAVLAAVFAAISPTLVANSRYVTPDMQVMFFVVLGAFAAILVLERGETWHYVLAGLAVGCATGTKYNGALVLAALAAAHFLRGGWRGVFSARLYLALSVAAVTFLATTPFALLAHREFIEGVTYEATHYATGHPGMEGDSFRWYLAYLGRTEGVLSVLALIQILRGVITRSKQTITLAVFPVVYLALIGSFVVRNERSLMLVLPFVHLLAALLILDVIRGLTAAAGPSRRVAALGAGLILPLFAMVRPMETTVWEARRAAAVDSRTTARVWIADNLPAGSRVAIEAYAPFVDGERNALFPATRMIDRSPEWYVVNHIDYLLFSHEMYGRFFADRAKYAREVALYDELFRRFPLTRMFSDGGYEIRVHQTAPKAP